MNTERLKNTLTEIYNKETREYRDANIIRDVIEDEGLFALMCGRALDDAACALEMLQRRTKDDELESLAARLQQQIATNTFLRP